MGLDLSQLEKVKHRGSNIIARCPACAESGNDRKGDHLFINPGGKFGCVIYPDADGRKHRQRIFRLAGIKEKLQNSFKIKKHFPPLVLKKKIIRKNILRRLGHIQPTLARNELGPPLYQSNNQDVCINSVPAVPLSSQRLYTSIESLKRIDEVRHIFSGTVLGIIEKTLMI